MAGKNGGIGEKIHALIVLAWVGVSIVFFAIACLITAPISTRLSRMIGTWWVRSLLVIAGVKVIVRGGEKLDPVKRYVFIANHQSQLDIPVLMGGLRHQLSFIAKKELFSIPFFGWGMYAAGHIWIDRTNARKARISIRRAISRLVKDNVSLAVFPEGTRSQDGVIGRFKQGSFSLVQQAGVEVVPVVIINTSALLTKHSLMIKKGTVMLSVCDPLKMDTSMSKAEISSRVHEIIVKEHEASNKQPYL